MPATACATEWRRKYKRAAVTESKTGKPKIKANTHPHKTPMMAVNAAAAAVCMLMSQNRVIVKSSVKFSVVNNVSEVKWESSSNQIDKAQMINPPTTADK